MSRRRTTTSRLVVLAVLALAGSGVVPLSAAPAAATPGCLDETAPTVLQNGCDDSTPPDTTLTPSTTPNAA
ncbi:MAG TPA: hypothetical protein VFY76_02210, partial [Nocardioides sp.]|nr:hypothetical protein [Nocardioides sp.]